MHWIALVSSLLAIVTMAMVPAFAILAHYQAYVLSIPIQFALLSIASYLTKFILSTVLMISTIIVYADAVFPLVMYSFAAIFQRAKID